MNLGIPDPPVLVELDAMISGWRRKAVLHPYSVDRLGHGVVGHIVRHIILERSIGITKI